MIFDMVLFVGTLNYGFGVRMILFCFLALLLVGSWSSMDLPCETVWSCGHRRDVPGCSWPRWETLSPNGKRPVLMLRSLTRVVHRRHFLSLRCRSNFEVDRVRCQTVAVCQEDFNCPVFMFGSPFLQSRRSTTTQ